MKILIVEDELLERKAMKKFIQDNFKDMEVIGEAVNGRLAIELAQALQPDIIFMDIKMPGINGLEAIEKIHASHPHIKFILVSAYDTFEYAKQAMRFGIKDYILKPGKTEEIVKALFRVRKEIIHEQSMTKEKEQAAELVKESLIRKLMKHPVEKDAVGLMQQIMPTMKAGYFLVFGASEALAVKQVQKSMVDHLDDPYIIYGAGDVVVVLVMLNRKLTKSEQLLATRKLSIDLGRDIFIGIGIMCSLLGHLPASYREAYAACFQLKIDRKSNYGFLQAEQQVDEQIIAHVLKEVDAGQADQAVRTVKEGFNHFTASTKEKLYISIQSCLTKRNINVETNSLSMLQTSADWEGFVHICCMAINEYHQSKQSMTRAREYLETNYAKAITLEDVANIVQLSPNYFSNLFKEEYDETFIELLTRIRMEKAKEFIEENTHSLKEISFMIGYKDPNYFSRVFKRYYDYSPNEFRKHIFEK